MSNSNPFENLSREIETYNNSSLYYANEKSLQTIFESLIDCWQSPHSAMEMLLGVAQTYPLTIANKLVHDVVVAWQSKNDYSWQAGGSADHCFLAALALTANGSLAEKEFIDLKKTSVISTYGENSRWSNYQTQDINEKVRLLTEFLEKGIPLSLESYYKSNNFGGICQLVTFDFSQINAELLAYFADHPERLQELHWRKFEELLDAVFRNQGYITELGPGRGDGGVDLRLIQKDSIGEILTLVQAKRYKENNPIELQAVQALHGVVTDQGAHRGLFVTTSRYLPGVQSFAEKQKGRLILATSNDVAAWCKSITKNNP